jgi:hypothetical protein
MFLISKRLVFDDSSLVLVLIVNFTALNRCAPGSIPALWAICRADAEITADVKLLVCGLELAVAKAVQSPPCRFCV